MSQRLTIGVDPGLLGAIAFLADGEFSDVIDMPTAGRGKKARQEVCAAQLADCLREHIAAHPGAYVHAVIEQVGARPGQGTSSMFNFGDGCGCVRGVLATLRIPMLRITPQAWKRHYGLLGADKDASRGLAIERFPTAPLVRKRDHGRAEAILIAAWAYRTEQVGAAA